MKKLNFPSQIEALANKAQSAHCENEALKFSQAALNLAHICTMQINDNEASRGATAASKAINRKSGWINVYIDKSVAGSIHSTKEIAISRKYQGSMLLDTVEVVWHE